MSAMNGISFALVQLSTACCSLESSRPGIAEVKAARVAASSAVDLLKATETFLANGVYVVCEEPKGPYVDPAEHRIEMPEATPTPAQAPEEITHIELDVLAALLPLPDLLGTFAELHPEAQAARFEEGLEQLWGTAPQEDTDEIPGTWCAPWRAAFAEGRLDTFGRLVYALEHRTPASIAFPTDEEMATWRAQFIAPLPPLPDLLLQFGDWDTDHAMSEFGRRTEALADLVDPEKKLDQALDPWDLLWERDQKDAFTRLLIAEEREPKSIIIPTDEERDAWLAMHAPAPEPAAIDEDAAAQAEDDKREQLFDSKLEELEETGVKESSLKRKNWKKAEKAWRLEFAGDAVKALDKLLWRLSRHVVLWEVPTDEEMPAAEEQVPA